MVEYHIYPGGKKRIVTFSYDDGHSNDKRLIELFDRYGVRATFHLNGINYIGKTDEQLEAVRERYKNHEIACHTVHHGWPQRMPLQSVIAETFDDRKILEKIAGYTVNGMSYPSGSYSNDVEEAMRFCGIVYSRTVKSTGDFMLPVNFLEWNPSCHHKDALPLCDRFLKNIDSQWAHPLFYIWGHSHELRTEEDWRHIAEVLEKISGNDKIWYATNMEIYDYTAAQKQLKISADEKIFTNPTATDVYVSVDKTKVICIPAGKTVTI